MSDFLSRLAERALGAAPAVRPLLGSRYASAASAEPEGFVEEMVERGVPRVPAPPQALAPSRPRAAPPSPAAVNDRHPAPAASDPASADPPPPPRAESASIDREPLTTAVDRDAEPPLVATSASTAASPSPYAPPDAPAPVRAQIHPSSPAAPAPHHDEPAVVARGEGTLVTVDEGRPVDGVQPRRAASTASTVSTASTASTASAQPVRGNADADVDDDGLLMPRIDVAPMDNGGDPRFGEEEDAGPSATGPAARTAPRAGAMESGAREVAAAEPGEEAGRPVVQVTIGRIEVRAVHPPAAPQPAREPGWTPPVLSLDEYLKRGSGR